MISQIRDTNIVVMGGGTGLAVLLKGLKQYTSSITAIVTVSDDGGSSGRLRTEMGVLPPGDIRNCLVALAETETLMDKIFQHRFLEGEGLKGHNLGNLLLVAMAEITGNFVSAIREVSKVLAVRGTVLPATLELVSLKAKMADGAIVCGETAIRKYTHKIEHISLVPEVCGPVVESLVAIKEADAIIIGPGSLYTSIIPNLLVSGISEAMQASRASIIYVSNIMTEKGETEDFNTLDHIRVINTHVGVNLIDYVVENIGKIDQGRLLRYRGEQAYPVKPSSKELKSMGIRVIERNLLSSDDLAWHDSDKLAWTILEIIGKEKLRRNVDVELMCNE